MAEVEGRFFNDYDNKKRLPMQVTLLNKLEKLGHETDGKYILTSKHLGVPITIMLLLMKEALEHISEEQRRIEQCSKLISVKTTDELKKEFNIEPKHNSKNNIGDVNWEYKQCVYANTEDVISGTTIFTKAKILIPEKSLNSPLEQVFESSNPKIKIYKNIIQETIKTPSSYSMIKLFKDTVLYLEFSYAVKERIRNETKNLKEITKKEIELPENYENFERNCQRRGNFIHGGHLNISIDHKNARLLLANSDLVSNFEKGLDEACLWVDEVYRRMLATLGN